MALTEIPVELSSTPGIADSSNATAITIDSSENVAITGTLSSTTLTATTGVLNLDDNGSHNGVINAPASLFVNIDSDNGATGENFVIAKDRTATSGGTELFRVQEDGSVGIGTTPNSGWSGASTSGRVPIQIGAGSISGRLNDNYTEFSNNCYASGTGNDPQWSGLTRYAKQQIEFDANGDMLFKNAATVAQNTFDSSPNFSFVDRVTIKNDGQVNFNTGLIAIGTTSRTGGASGANVAIEFAGDNNNGLKMRDTDTNAGAATFVFVSGSSIVGSVTTSSSSTTYNTSSDYRLKENVNYDWDALSTLTQLKPAKFNFKTDADNTVEGFLAHEVSGLVPAAVKGEKDAMETRTKLVLDSDGVVIEEGVEEDAWTAGKENKTYPADSTWEASKEFPDYQQIDQSKLVPLLVKAIQELEAKVKALEEA
jgi:hypothetical protein